jgi:integrase/recombinase XerD
MQKKPEIKLEHGHHRDQDVVLIKFVYNRRLIEEVKKLVGSRWSQTKQCWYIPLKVFHLDKILNSMVSIADINVSALENQRISNISSGEKKKIPLPELPKEYLALLQQKRYSKSTIRTYTSYFSHFQDYFSEDSLKNISIERINDYILELIHEKAISPSQQNQRINAIKFYYERVLGR